MSELGKGFHAGFAASVTKVDESTRQLVRPKFEYFLRTVDNREMSLSFHVSPSARSSVRCALMNASAGALLLLAGCSSEPSKPTNPVPAEPPKAISGQVAFYRMFPAARQWAGDAQGIQLISIHLQDVQGPPGTAGAWQAIFVSPGQHKRKTFSWAAIDAPGNVKQGVFGSDPGDFNGKIDQAVPFFKEALHVDSTEAFKSLDVAATKGEPINFLLEQTSRFPDLTWRVIWGESVGTASKTGFVDATTGKVLEKVR
jgi:hypothetical protein